MRINVSRFSSIILPRYCRICSIFVVPPSNIFIFAHRWAVEKRTSSCKLRWKLHQNWHSNAYTICFESSDHPWPVLDTKLDLFPLAPAFDAQSPPNLAWRYVRQNVIKEIRLKNLTLVYRLSRSFKVIRTDADRCATYYFPLTFHSNHGPISHSFQNKQWFPWKIANFIHPRVLCAHAEGVPLGVWCQRRRSKN